MPHRSTTRKPGHTPATTASSATSGLAAALAAGLLLAPAAHAANGTWTTDADGNWSDTVKWSGGIVADGADFTADFSTIDITGDRKVTLDGNRTIGNLIFGDTATGTAGSWTVSDNTLTLDVTSGTPTITVNALGTGKYARINSNLTGSDGLVKDGTGILVLAGANDYSGGTTISLGKLSAASNTALGTGSVTVASGATLELKNVSLSNTINLNGTSAIVLGDPSTNTLSGTVNVQTDSKVTGNNGKLTLSGTINGSAQLTLSNINGITTISNDNSSTFSGSVRVERSTLAVGHNGALGTGTFTLGVNDQASGIRSTDATARGIANAFALVGSLNSTYNFGSSTAAVNGDLNFTNASDISLGGLVKKFQVYNKTTFNGGFTSGNGGITMQTGTGTLVLNGATNSYTGATTVNAGTLVINGSKTGAGAINVNSGGTLGGTGTLGGILTVNAGGTLAPGNSIGTINTSNLSLAGTLDVELGRSAGTPTSDRTNVTGTVTLSAGADLKLTRYAELTDPQVGDIFYLISNDLADGITGTFTKLNGTATTLSEGSLFDWNLQQWQITYLADDNTGFTGGNDLAIKVVPEPAALALLLVGAVGLLRRREPAVQAVLAGRKTARRASSEPRV